MPLWIAFIVTFVSAFACGAQTIGSLSIDEFRTSLRDYFCTAIPTGRQNLAGSSSGLTPGSQSNDWLIAMQTIGVIDIKYLSPSTYEIELRYPLDGTTLRSRDGKPCEQTLEFGSAKFLILRKDEAKGGRTGWSAQIAYIEVTNVTVTELEKKHWELRGIKLTDQDPAQYRVLFRQDPFTGNWRFAAWDLYDHGQFLTNNVGKQLDID